jgi:hypothetical protein
LKTSATFILFSRQDDLSFNGSLYLPSKRDQREQSYSNPPFRAVDPAQDLGSACLVPLAATMPSHHRNALDVVGAGSVAGCGESPLDGGHAWAGKEEVPGAMEGVFGRVEYPPPFRDE